MDSRFLKLYNRELQHVREMGGAFAKEFPKIAGRLGLEGFECADPYVERLLEGFAFMAARIQLRLDAEFPRFTQNLLQTVFPNYVTPTPSMAVVQFQPEAGGIPPEGLEVARGTSLRSRVGKGDPTACEYRTSQNVSLWPLEITQAEYFRYTGAVASIDIPRIDRVRAGVRLRLRTTGDVPFSKLALDHLDLYLRGADELPMRIYEQMLGNVRAVVARPTSLPASWHEVVDAGRVSRLGFDEDEALLPSVNREFSGYRLLHEYFAFPARFMFVRIGGLSSAVKRCRDRELDLLVLFDRANPALENAIDGSEFALFCTPAINLFPKRADRIQLDEREHEYHVLPDRTRPLDYEVYDITEVVGHGTKGDPDQEFLPFYATSDRTRYREHKAFFTIRREARMLSSHQQARGNRSTYMGGEAFIALVDPSEAPYRSTLRQLSVNVTATNRDLPLQMPVGSGTTDFTMGSGAPVASVRVVAGPTKPRAAFPVGDSAWRLISHLSLNYLSLADTDRVQGAAALRELLGLYGDVSEAWVRKQVEGVRSVETASITRRIPLEGAVAYGRGLEVAVTLDEGAFEGSGVFLLGAVLDQFFARYVSINSFTETVVRTVDRGEVARWPVRIGKRQIL